MTLRTIAQVTDADGYAGLVAAFRSRANELRVSRMTLDHVAGLPAGYVGKILGKKQVRRVGMWSLGPLLGALGLKLIVVEDKEAMRRHALKLTKRMEFCVRGEGKRP